MKTRCMEVFLAVLLAATVSVSVADDRGQVQGGEQRPNILILMAEDMSSRVGAFGDSIALTPNLDTLAEAGVRFPNTFTTAGVCAPSRAAHITGVHQIAFGAQHMRTRSFKPTPYRSVPPAEVKAYPELLRAAGYYTFTNHKLDYQFSNYGADTGPFTIWDYEGNKPGWDLRDKGQPFFGLINFGITHESQMFSKNVKKNLENGIPQRVAPDMVAVPPYYPDTPTVRKDIARQYDNISEMDRQVGLWLERLRKDGLDDNTIVIWTTDHGDGLPRAKREIYDSGIRVPMIVFWPERLRPAHINPGSEDRRLISFIDFAPSVLHWAGAAKPDFLQGKPVLADSGIERQYVYASKDRLDEFSFRERAVRDYRFKYIRNYRAGEPGAKHLAYRDQLDIMNELWTWYENGRLSSQQSFWFEPRPEEELYDLSVDPWEVNNLAGEPDYSATLERMSGALNEWQSRVRDYSDQPESEMALQFWPDGKQPVTLTPVIHFEGNVVTVECPTEGASIGYTLDSGVSWKLYTGPVALSPGDSISVKAVRYGWQESETRTVGVAGN